MGKYFSFIMDDFDESKFVEFILEDGEIYFEGDLHKPTRVYELPRKFSGKGWFKVYLYKKEFGELVYDKLESKREIIDPTKSPVIEFIRTIVRVDDREIKRGRLWVETEYYNEQGQLVDKTKELSDWFNRLTKWIKNDLPKLEFNTNNKVTVEYASPNIKNLLENGYKLTY